jgi:iron(III) transport system substrate-binding protein
MRRVLLGLSLLLAALPNASRLAYAQASPQAIVVYNAQHASLTQEWSDGFTRESGVKITIRKGGELELGNQIVQEGSASPADVFLTENSPAMALVDKAELFKPLQPDVLSLVPEQFRPQNGNWLGVAARTTVFAYNKTKLKPDQLPKSLLDLADARWKGRWAASPSGADFQAIVSALLEMKGEEATLAWLKAMKANARIYRGNVAVMKAVNAGEIDGGVIYHYYYFTDQAKTGENSGNVALHYFRNKDPGAFVSISGAGVLASSKHASEAEAFIKWIAGKGQDVLRTGGSFEYAIGLGAHSNPKLEPLAKLDPPVVSPDKLNNKKVVDLMSAAGLL